MLELLDKFLIWFHLLFTAFNLFGWVPKKTRRLNLVTLSLTAFSWLGLGLFYGIGYCPLTDWHWAIREKLGHTDMPVSYIKFILDEVTGLDFNPAIVDSSVAVSFTLALIFSLYMNLCRKA